MLSSVTNYGGLRMYCERDYKITCKGCSLVNYGRDCHNQALNGFENSSGRVLAQYTEGRTSPDELRVIMPDVVVRMSWAVNELSDLQVDFPEWYEEMRDQVDVLETCLLLLKESVNVQG